MLAAHAWSAHLLTRYGPACDAQAMSVWSCTHGRLDLVCDWLGSQRLRNVLHTRWPALLDELRSGSAVHLVGATRALPVYAPREGLLGVLLFTGVWPPSTGVRALLDDLAQRLRAALRDPLPAPQPDVLLLPLAQINVPRGDALASQRVYTTLLECCGGSTVLLSRRLGVPRQTLENRFKRLGVRANGWRPLRVVPERLDLEPVALDMEQRTCREVLARCRGDVRVSAAALHLTPGAWRAYLGALNVALPAPRRRAPRRRQA